MTNTNTAQMVADLSASNDAVRGMGWVSPGLGVPGSPLGLLTSTLNPLSTLVTAGLGWFGPMVSFLGEPLSQLQGGNSASVTSGSQSFNEAGQNMDGVAGAYKGAISAETTGWSGAAASDYRATATQHANGVAGLGHASTTTGSAIIGAGQVVAQAVAEVTEIISEAVGEIVPIMTQAVAQSETNPGAVPQAIPPCVGIAAAAAAKCAAKLAALLASGDNLMKLVQGAMGVVDLIKTALSSISQQSVRPDAEPNPSAGADQPQAGSPASSMAAANPGNAMGATDSRRGAASAPSSSARGFSGGAPLPGHTSTPDGSAVPGAAPLGVAAQSTGAIPLSHETMPNAPQYPSHASGSTGAAPGGAVPIGAAGLGGGARTGAGRGADTVRQDRRQAPANTPTGGNGTRGGAPLGGMGGARAAGETDKEHQRKYGVVEQFDEIFNDGTDSVAPPVIGSTEPT
ncbi:WXG100 family type VII secretion target [Actinocrispum wychmicini]|uniref:PPE family protein n=1 Tax=Actinocrispum wychmicini TaxID=1213861 RepID=A0A4R2JK08_9PSEU|nr:hypothetical protein [Actinocrispum wychmicini]TCO59474.1 hypothetical protein EV192_104316 [Actinocrispum wychmicini]